MLMNNKTGLAVMHVLYKKDFFPEGLIFYDKFLHCLFLSKLLNAIRKRRQFKCKHGITFTNKRIKIVFFLTFTTLSHEIQRFVTSKCSKRATV